MELRFDYYDIDLSIKTNSEIDRFEYENLNKKKEKIMKHTLYS